MNPDFGPYYEAREPGRRERADVVINVVINPADVAINRGTTKIGNIEIGNASTSATFIKTV